MTLAASRHCSVILLSHVSIYRLCLGTLVRFLRARRSLLLENLALPQQLAVLKRRHPRPRLARPARQALLGRRPSILVRMAKLVCGAKQFAGALADDDAGSHGVAGGHSRHYRAVCDAKVFNAMNLKLGVYDRHRIAPHLGGTRLMEVGRGCIANEVL
jgi:hypothetical protein